MDTGFIKLDQAKYRYNYSLTFIYVVIWNWLFSERNNKDASDRSINARRRRSSIRWLGADGVQRQRQRTGLARLLALRAVPRTQPQSTLQILREMFQGMYASLALPTSVATPYPSFIATSNPRPLVVASLPAASNLLVYRIGCYRSPVSWSTSPTPSL